MSEPVLWLRGDRAAIGPIRADLAEHYWRWEQEIPTIVGYNRQTPQPLDVTQDLMIRNYSDTSDRQLRFTVYETTSQHAPTPVGLALVYLDPMRRTGEYVIALGEPESRGKGVGSDATRLVLDYAFHVTNLRCVYLTVLEPNSGAIMAYERAGFVRQGIRRNSSQWLGETVNEVHMDAIPEDWTGRSRVKEQFAR